METITTPTTLVETRQPRLFPAKLRAALIHIGISAIIFLVFLYLILIEWYPPPFFTTDGGWNGVLIIVLVDIVLGPTLTFIIFNPRKSRKEILLDLSIVAVVQLGALAWGGYTVYNQRPVAVVEWEGVLKPLTAEPLYAQEKTLADLQQFGVGPRPIIRAEPPKTKDEIGTMMELAFNKGIGETQQFWMFRSFEGSLVEIRKRALDITAVTKANAEINAELDKFLQKNSGKKAEDFFYLKFAGRYKDAIFMFDTAGDLVGTLTWGAPERLP